MKNFYVNDFNNIYTLNNENNPNSKLFQKFDSMNKKSNTIISKNLFNQNQIKNIKNKNYNLNFKNNNVQQSNINQPVSIPPNIKMTKNISPKKRFNYMKNANPPHMRYSNAVNAAANKTKKAFYQHNYKTHEVFMNISNQNTQNTSNKNSNKNLSERASLSMSKNSINSNNNSNNNIFQDYQNRKMGFSQMNFYSNKNKNYFPDIHSQKQNNNINRKNEMYMHYSHQQQLLYNDFFDSLLRNPPNVKNENFAYIFDFEYKRPEEKLKKGQNQLILERLQKKYLTQSKEKNMLRTGTGFYPKKNNNKNIPKARQYSAQDNVIDAGKGMANIDKKIPINNNKDKNTLNNFDNNKISKEKESINDNNNIMNKEKKFNKTYNNGFNIKKFNKEKRKKEKKILLKIVKSFNKKANYFWVKYFNKKRKARYEYEEDNQKKNKSYDNKLMLLYSKLIKRCLHTNLIHNKRNYHNKNNLKYNTDNSEIDEIKEYKKYQKKIKNGKSDYANFIRTNKNYKEEDKNDYNSESESSEIGKKEPKFRGLFDNDKNDNQNDKNKDKNEKKNFNFKTTTNFYNNNFNFNNQNGKNTDEKKNCKDDSEKEKQNKFNIENIINNVIENNKKAAAARSSTSFYNIGSNFMNNHMRSTKTKFYNPKENRGGGFTGTKDSNFTKEQANEGKFYKPNSLKITLINPLNWRKHEEIWDNLISLSLGLADLEKYLMPPNETDVLVSSYLKMNPRILNFCSLQKINTSNTKNENNFISFMIDDNIQNPKQELKKWKEAYKRVILRWHPDKLYSTLEEIKFKNEQQKIELKKKSTLIINNMNTLYKNIMEILNKIMLAKNDNSNDA